MAASLWFCTAALAVKPAPEVVVTVAPLHSIAASLMARVGTPRLLIKGAGSPHHYAMRPSGVRALRNAAVIFWVGPGLEEFLVRPLQRLPRGTKIVGLGSATPTTGSDPHIWLDPESAKHIARRMAATLKKADPRHRNFYTQNLAALERRLSELDHFLRGRLEPIRKRPFVVYHNAYSRLVARYRLNQRAFVVRDPEVPPGTRRMSEIRSLLVRDGVACLFTEPQFPAARLRPVTRGSTVRVAALDPLGATVKPGQDAYFMMMWALARSLHDCLAHR